MIKEILTIISMFLAGYLFSKLRPIIFRRAKDMTKEHILENKRKKLRKYYNECKKQQKKVVTNSSIGKSYQIDAKEPFQWKKFRKIFDLGSGVEWIKSIKEIMDLRKLTIYLLIVGCVFGYGWYKGKLNTPIQMNLAYDKEFKLDLNGEYLHKPKYSHDVYIKDDKTGKILKHIKAKDFPDLKRKLAPIGFQLKFVGIGGLGIGEKDTGFEAGAGLSWLRYWRWEIESFLTNKGIYPLGTSYSLTDNSNLGLGIGKGWKGDNRVIMYYRWKF